VPNEADPTPLDDCSVPDESGEEDEELVELDEVDVLAAWLEDEEVPGMVAALTAVNTPSPAKAAIAAPVVRRLSLLNPASRARILAWVGFVLFIVRKFEGLL
jgi:hypothetical protein